MYFQINFHRYIKDKSSLPEFSVSKMINFVSHKEKCDTIQKKKFFLINKKQK